MTRTLELLVQIGKLIRALNTATKAAIEIYSIVDQMIGVDTVADGITDVDL